MKHLLIALSAAVICASAYACTTYTIMTPNGMATCTKCCDSYGNCTVSCF